MTVWNAWKNRHLWPEVDPTGYVFLGHAFDAAGEAIFPNWSGHEVEDADLQVPVRIPTVEQAYIDGKPHFGFHKSYGPEIRTMCGLFDDQEIPQSAWSAVAEDRLNGWRKVIEARFRRDEVIRRLSELARSGELLFASRRKGGGQMPKPIRQDSWELDYSWMPFATLGWDEGLGLASPAPSSWLFVDARSFAGCLGLNESSSSVAAYLLHQAAEADAMRYLFEEGEWVPASQALKQVGTSESLIKYAGTDDGERPFLRTRCAVLDGKTIDGRETRQKRELHTWFWSNFDGVTSDWEVGLFVRRDGQTGTEYTASCVEFSLTDIQSLKGDADALTPTVPTPSKSDDIRPGLPANAKANDHKHADYAHKAAEMLRSDKSLKAEKAFSIVAPNDPSRERTSVIRAIRKSFELMYRLDGVPHQN